MLKSKLKISYVEGDSMPRNKELMRIFRDLDLVEHLGSGMSRILQAYPKSSFRFTENFIRMSFPASGKSKVKNEEKSSEKGSEKSSEKIIRMLRADPQRSAADLAELIGISPRAVEKQITKLKEAGRLQRVGPDKGGHWEVIGKDEG